MLKTNITHCLLDSLSSDLNFATNRSVLSLARLPSISKLSPDMFVAMVDHLQRLANGFWATTSLRSLMSSSDVNLNLLLSRSAHFYKYKDVKSY